VPGYGPSQLGRLIVTPFATIGVLAAVLVWEVEHVGSILLAVAIAAGGVLIGVIVSRQLRQDIDTISEYYQALLHGAEEQSRQADAANRLKDEFLSTVSHELRTPLNSVLGWAHLLARGKLDHEQSVRAVLAIERAGWTQARLIDDLLDLSHIVAGTLELTIEPTLLVPLIESTVESLRPAADAKRIAVTLALDRGLGPLAADTARVKQVVRNLVSNAIKFTPPGGCIDVQLDASADEVRLAVQDTGIGLSADVAAHLFERFRQGDSSSTREHGGLGLGLGIVRHIVELHGGSVRASSHGEHAGSTFEVRLPRRLMAAPVVRSHDTAKSSLALRGVTVVVVNDDRHAMEFVRKVLEPHGATVIEAGSQDAPHARPA